MRSSTPAPPAEFQARSRLSGFLKRLSARVPGPSSNPILPKLRDEQGSVLIEAVVSGVLVIILAGGIFGGIEAAARSGQEERARTRAQTLAEADQQRMRSLDVGTLNNLTQTRTVTEPETTYTIVSTARFVSDSTGTSTCSGAGATADYIKIKSSISWPSMGVRTPVEITGIVAPTLSEISQTRGALIVTVFDQNGMPIPGVGLSGTGAGSFSGTTEAEGCALFANLPEGNYDLTTNAAGLVDKDGNPAGNRTVSVTAQATNSIVIELGQPGSIQANFVTNGYGGPVASTKASFLRVFHTNMTTARSYGTAGTYVDPLVVSQVFPYTSPVSLYAGACDGHHPNPSGNPANPEAVGVSSATVTSGSTVAATVRLPSLNLTVYTGKNPSGQTASGATVFIRDKVCPNPAGGGNLDQTLTTDANGRLTNPGLPYGTYDVCVTDGSRRMRYFNVNVKNYASGTTLNVPLKDNANENTGTCP